MNLLVAAFPHYFEASCFAAVFIAVWLAVRKPLRRWLPAKTIYVVLVFLCVRLLVPIFGQVQVMPADWRYYYGVTKDVTGMFVAMSTPVVTRVAASGEVVSSPSRTMEGVQWTVGHWSDLLVALWLGGFVVLELIRRFHRRAFHRKVLASGAPADPRIGSIIAAEWKAMGFLREVFAPSEDSFHSVYNLWWSRWPQRIPTAIATPAVGAPACYGASWRTSWILFPPGFAEQLNDEELRLIVLHEMAHFSRGDLRTLGLLQFAARLHWFNPLVWCGLAAARADCEAACDAAVLEKIAPGEAQAYGLVLLKAVGLMRAPSSPIPAVGIFENRLLLKERIQRVASYRRPGPLITFNGLVVIMAVWLLIFLPSFSMRGAASGPGADSAHVIPSLAQQRFQDAQQLAREGKSAEALSGMLWCFDDGMKNAVGMSGVRRSFLMEALARLGDTYPPARQAMVDRRDQARKNLTSRAGDATDWPDYVALNHYLGDDSVTLAFYDQAKSSGAHVPPALWIFNQLLVARMYADALAARPFASYASQFDMYSHFMALTPQRVPREVQIQYLAKMSADELEVLAGTDDLADARAVVAKMLQTDKSAETVATLRERAIRVGHPELAPAN